jgi:hypothetical protein
MTTIRTAEELRQAHDLTSLFVANQLGSKPGGQAAQDDAIRRCQTALETSPLEEAAVARHILAVEFTAWTELAAGHRPTQQQWEQAIGIVGMASPEDVRNRARGGMYLRAVDAWGLSQ